jgi:hypothetical protein
MSKLWKTITAAAVAAALAAIAWTAIVPHSDPAPSREAVARQLCAQPTVTVHDVWDLSPTKAFVRFNADHWPTAHVVLVGGRWVPDRSEYPSGCEVMGGGL